MCQGQKLQLMGLGPTFFQKSLGHSLLLLTKLPPSWPVLKLLNYKPAGTHNKGLKRLRICRISHADLCFRVGPSDLHFCSAPGNLLVYRSCKQLKHDAPYKSGLMTLESWIPSLVPAGPRQGLREHPPSNETSKLLGHGKINTRKQKPITGF